jgi:RNase P subunit RPR2
MINLSIQQLYILHHSDLPRDIKKIICQYCKRKFNSLWNYPVPIRHKISMSIIVYGKYCNIFKYKGQNIKKKIESIHMYRKVNHKYISGMLFQDLR